MTAASRPVVQMFEQIFGEAQIQENAGLGKLRSYLEQGGSIFPLVEKGAQALVSEHQLSVDDARQLIRRANSYVTYIRREFIEHTLKGDKTTPTDPSSGLLSMVDGPKYEIIFETPFDSMCPPEALESCISPVAYLIDLLRWVLLRIESVGDATQKLPLHDRRTDLRLLSVDGPAVYQAVSSVDIIIAVLEKFITAEQPGSIEDALITARYPNGLPYYQHWVTIDGVARSKGLSVGDFGRTIDLSYPYFLPSVVSAVRNTRALAHASRLGPYQRNLLTEPMYVIKHAEDFYRDNFGTVGPSWGNLNQVSYFGEATKLGAVEIERLLSVGDFAPVRSANIDYVDDPDVSAESARSGSVYINANVHPGIRINYTEAEHLNRLTIYPETQAGLTAIDRMNRKLRLDNWLELPSEQVDSLLSAAIRAEARSTDRAPTWEISANVVHALGLFQHLRERYRCTAADFAVIVDQLSIYGRGETLSQFDQIFNGQGAYREPLKLGDGLFPVTPVPGEADLTISQLCNGLGIDLQTYHYLALAVAGAYKREDTLILTPAIVSSFCRLVILPRLFNMTPVEGVLMLTLLGGQQWLDGLAGVPFINASASSKPDVLSLVEAMDTCVQWCEQSNLSVLWVLQHIAVPQRVSIASESDLQFFDQITNLLPAARLSNDAFLTAGVPSIGSASLMDLLSTAKEERGLVDHYGLVLPYAGTPEEYEAFARSKLMWVVENAFGELDKSVHDSLLNTMLAVILQARDAQVSLLRETLAVYAGIPAGHTIPILSWAKATTHFLLDQVVSHIAQGRRDAGGPLFDLLAEVRRRSEVAMTLNLSAELLQDYLDYGHKVWFGKDPNAEPELSVRTLYYLSTLTRAFDLGRQPPQKLLDYLRQVNALPKITGNALRLAQQASSIRLAEFFGWSTQDVRDSLRLIDKSGNLVLGDLIELDLLMRVRVLSGKTGMDASTIFQIGNLPETVDKEAYAKAAELALLNESRAQVPLVHAPGDLKALVKTRSEIIDSNSLIAKKPGEKATYRVTVTDAADIPLSGVNVYWQTTLGAMRNKATDIKGQVEVEYRPGEVMGTDQVLYWLDLFEPEPAPPVVIGSDAHSMGFPGELKSPIPLGIVPRGQEVELYATAQDRYGNLGKDVYLKWFAVSVAPAKANQAIIRPPDGSTNQEGQTRVVVSSPTGGTFIFSVRTDGGGSEAYFEPITFAGDEAEQ
ncbi:virulence plasmid 28 protein [Pseudomonas fluorescens]|uniref:Tc toxin subunit A n=1 Tax=Pseudomonas fluorescens TaxID=294 RepID=UPI001130F8E7|nr:Tc toxin subunit A [Pseudomonas fluorescens]TMU81688.1 virulence plasmid 28 protein [Pseudomonas fluorescens]